MITELIMGSLIIFLAYETCNKKEFDNKDPEDDEF